MAKDKPAKYWRFKLDTRRKFTELSQEIARINSGGGEDIDLTAYATKVWVEAKGYITASALTPYALKTDIPSLVGYATEDFVTTKLVDYAPLTSVQGFENRIGGLEGAVPQLNERVEQLALTKLDSSYFTQTNIQSTLGISDWALASVKPTYTASEVGALSLDGTSKMQQSKNIEWSNTEGSEDIDVFSNGLRLLGYNASKGNYGGGIHIGTRYGWQLMTKYGENPLYYRSYNIGSQIWRDWKTLAFTSDIPTKLSQLTDDVVAGRYLPLSGGTLSNALWRSQLTIERSGSTNDSVIAFKNSNGLLGCLGYRGADSIPCVWLGESGTGAPIIHADNIGNYNAGSATKLQTPRTLWGKSFDGTDNVSGDINNAAGGIYIHNTNEINSFQGKLYLNHRGSGQTGYGSTNDIVMVANGGNVSIGTTSPTERLDVSGNIKASGNINATSITINGVTITASNGSITVNGNVLATGAITAKAVG